MKKDLLGALLVLTGVMYGCGGSTTAAPTSTALAEHAGDNSPPALTVTNTISNIGSVNDVALSSDGKTLFVATTDSCAAADDCTTVAGDGGLYTFDVSNPLTPFMLGRIQQPTAGYQWTTYNGISLSSDSSTAFVASGEQQFQVIDVSKPASPKFNSAISTTCAAMALTPSLDRLSYYVSNACGDILTVNVKDRFSPSIASKLSTNNQYYGLEMSPDGTQMIATDQGAAVGIDVYGQTLNLATSIDSLISSPVAAAKYIGPGTLLTAAEDYISVYNVTTPSAPILIGRIATGTSLPALPAPAEMSQIFNRGGIAYNQSLHLAYVAVDSNFYIVDLNDPARPAIRGAATFSSGSDTAVHIGVAARPDGSTVYLVNHGQVKVLSVP